MQKNKIVGVIILLSLLVIMLIFFIINRNSKDNENINKEDYTQIYFYDLGNSNMEIIKKNEFTIVINTGLEIDRDMIIDYFEQLGIERIDYLILTNRNDEYIGNSSFILENYLVDYIYINDYEYSSDYVDKLFNTLSDSYTEEIILTSNENIKIDELKINIYPYLEDNFTMEDKEFIIEIEEGVYRLYLTGNASFKRLKEIDKGTLIASRNKDVLDKDFDYYIYDGNDKVNNKKKINRNSIIYMNEKEFILDK